MGKVAVYPGFNQNIMDALKMKFANTPPNNKLVALVIDEMSIKEGVTYDSGSDLLEGLSVGKKREKVLANHAIAFMIRGIQEKWKQPIG